MTEPAISSVEDDGMGATTALVRMLFAAMDANDLDSFDPHIHPDYQFHLPGQSPMGWDGNKALTAHMLAAFPDLHHRIESTMSDGAQVAVRLTVSGTQRGELQGIPPTDRFVEFASMAMFRLSDGQIIEYRLLFDQFGLLQQLGVIPA